MNSQKILIVDDDHDIVDAIEAILLMEDYVVSHAYEGLEGVNEARNFKPHLILLDYMLPDMNGKEVAETLRLDDNLKDIPVVLVSAAREAREIALQIPVNDFIEKPFEMEHLLSVVRRQILA